MTKIFMIEGMTCSRCEHAVNKALKLKGIGKVNTDIKAKSSRVEFNPLIITEKEIKGIIEDLGYTVTGVTD